MPRAIRTREMRTSARRSVGAGHAVVLGLALALMAAVANTVLMGAAAGFGGTCVACHAMKPYETASRVSGHQEMACPSCHSDAGALALLANGTAMQRRVLSAITRKPVTLGSWTGDASCRSCHSGVLTRTVRSASGIVVRHEDFADVSCLECHAGTGHPLSRRVYSAARMEDCTGCHRVTYRNADACEMCHAEDWNAESSLSPTTWRITHGPKWQETHGMGDLSRCSMCHKQSYCVDCHGTAIPHPAAWQHSHGNGLSAAKRAECEKCHSSQWCLACHGIEMPHADGFLKDHTAIGKQTGDGLCLRCHVASACEECHRLAEHPDVPGVDRKHKR